MAQVKVDLHLYHALQAGGIDAAIQFSEARAEGMLKAKGTEISRDIKEYIVKNAVAEVRQLTTDIRKAHLSDSLVKLLEAKSKKAALKVIDKELVLEQDEFAKFIENAELFGYFHERKHKEFVPPDLRNVDHKVFGNADPKTGELTKEAKKAFNQVAQIIKTRRQLSVHLFHFGFEWHCFYFDFSDLLKGHWVGGDHIHYLSHHWGISSAQVWDGFDGKGASPGHAHIRYRHDLRENQNKK